MAAEAGSVQETSTRSGLENALWDLKGGQYSTAATPTSLPTPPQTYVLFLANLDAETGESWCPDCREALPVITAAWERVQEKHRAEAKEGVPAPVLVKAWVGDRPTWKGPNNPFKILPFCVTCVPSLLKWDYGDLSKGINLGKALPGRLGDEGCKDPALVANMFGLA